MWKRLKNSKTARLAVGGILATIAALIADKIEMGEAVKLVMGQLFVLFVRDGIEKIKGD